MAKNKHKILSFIYSTLIGVSFFVMLRPKITQALVNEGSIGAYIDPSEISVGSKKGNRGMRQIHYSYKGKKVQITDNNFTNADPVIDGDHIAWMSQIDGKWQVFYYHIPSGKKTQLSYLGNNVNPSISGNSVAWEGQVDGIWQAFYFDGVRVWQLTNSSYPIQGVYLVDKYVAYLQLNAGGSNESLFVYNTKNKTTIEMNLHNNDDVEVSGRAVTWEKKNKDKVSRYKYSFYDGRFYFSERDVIKNIPVEDTTEDSSPEPDQTTPVVPEIIVSDTILDEVILDEEVLSAPEVIVEEDEPADIGNTMPSEGSEETSGSESSVPIESELSEPAEDILEVPETVDEEDIEEELGVGDTSPEEVTTEPPEEEIIVPTPEEEPIVEEEEESPDTEEEIPPPTETEGEEEVEPSPDSETS